MDLIEGIPEAKASLARARLPEAERIAASVEAHRVVGVLGEGEVGKSEVVRTALDMADGNAAIVCLDMDAVAGDPHVGFLLAKAVARRIAGEADLSLLSAGALWPSRVEKTRHELAGLMGLAGLDEALRRWPTGAFSAAAGLELVEVLARRRPVILWIDHLESPSLTPRHPVRVDRVLWGVREMTQREPRIKVVLSGRKALERELLGRKAAFHQQGRWLSIDNPPPAVWREVAERMRIWPPLAAGLAEVTQGHPATMLHALLHIRQTTAGYRRLLDPRGILRTLAARDDGLAGRAVQHARTLHRLGAQVLTQIAHGERPYAVEQRGSSVPQEIRKVLERLRLAGLVRPGEHWAVVNPLLAIRLGQSLDDFADPSDREDDQS